MVDEKRILGEEKEVFKIKKANDHLDQGFLDCALERKGFSTRWRSWMRGYVFNKFCLLSEQKAKGWFKATRGLRQGNPFPLSFSSLQWNLKQDVDKSKGDWYFGRVPSREVQNQGVIFSLQMTLSFVFSSVSAEELQNFKFILLIFWCISGLKINLEKNMLGINTSWDRIFRLVLMLKCKFSK